MRIDPARLIAWAAPVSAMAVVSVSISLSVPLFALLLERLGVSGTAIGLNHTIAALAMVVTAPILPLVLGRIGLVRLMLGAVVVLALCTIAIPLFQNAWWWALLRIGWGIAGTALFFASEYWVVTAAPHHLRGRIVGAYVVILSGSYMVGPLLLNLLGIDSWLTFAVPTAIILLSAVPLILGRKAAPDPEPGDAASPLALFRFFRTDPMVTWGVVLFGIIEFGAMGLITVWGVRTGYSQETAVQLVFWLALGSMAFQLPVGWAADRFDRRKLLALAGVVSTVTPLAMIALTATPGLVAAGVVLWGGMAVAFYALALTELGARYSGAVMARANAAVVLAYGVGALISPAAFGAAMDAIPPNGLLWAAAAAAAAYVALAAVRIARAPRESLDRTPETSR